MQRKALSHVGKCLGSAVVGARGQVVVPVEARRELGIQPGTRLLAFDVLEGSGLLFLKVEAVEGLVNAMNERVSEFAGLLEGTKSDSRE